MTIQPYNHNSSAVDGPVVQDALTQGEYETLKAALRNTGLRTNELLALKGHHCKLACGLAMH